jgi:uncharacterized protein (DUF1015 family)
VISPEERSALLARDPDNVVRLTLGDSEEESGRLFRSWLADGVLVRDAEPALWTLEQEYTGPDGIARTRRGVVGSLRVEPYERRIVLPHERTHAGPKESRLRLLRAAHAELEPILLLYDCEPFVEPPGAVPDLDVDGTRLWRLADPGIGGFFADRQLLIADGHHRYETALAYAAEEGTAESARMMVVLVSTADPGLEIFATHRVFAGRPDLRAFVSDWQDEVFDLPDALERLESEPFDHSAVVAFAGARARLLRGEPGELDVELVDAFGHEGISYTPDRQDAVGRVERGEADVAFLLRPTRIEDVFVRARRGEVLPPKTTYFFPKLLSGLLFHPLDQ